MQYVQASVEEVVCVGVAAHRSRSPNASSRAVLHQHARWGAAARVTLAFRDNDDDDDAVCLLLHSGDRLRVVS